MESLSHGTDNEEKKINPRVSYTDYSERPVLNSAQEYQEKIDSIICDYLNWAKNANQICLYFL